MSYTNFSNYSSSFPCLKSRSLPCTEFHLFLICELVSYAFLIQQVRNGWIPQTINFKSAIMQTFVTFKLQWVWSKQIMFAVSQFSDVSLITKACQLRLITYSLSLAWVLWVKSVTVQIIKAVNCFGNVCNHRKLLVSQINHIIQPHLLWCPAAFSSDWTQVPSVCEHLQRPVNSC